MYNRRRTRGRKGKSSHKMDSLLLYPLRFPTIRPNLARPLIFRDFEYCLVHEFRGLAHSETQRHWKQEKIWILTSISGAEQSAGDLICLNYSKSLRIVRTRNIHAQHAVGKRRRWMLWGSKPVNSETKSPSNSRFDFPRFVSKTVIEDNRWGIDCFNCGVSLWNL